MNSGKGIAKTITAFAFLSTKKGSLDLEILDSVFASATPTSFASS